VLRKKLRRREMLALLTSLSRRGLTLKPAAERNGVAFTVWP